MSHVGLVPGRTTEIRLGSSCLKDGIILHELHHALGFYHEQNRPDRDEFVQVFSENIQPNMYELNYGILPHMPTHGLQYDYESILHYAAWDFAKSRDKPAIIPKIRSPGRMGQRKWLSALDVTKLQKAYGCIDDNFERVESMPQLHCDVSSTSGKPGYQTTIGMDSANTVSTTTAATAAASEKSPATIRFSDLMWTVMEMSDPGVNNIQVINDHLHLRLTKRNNFFHCAGVRSVDTFGFGRHQFHIESRLDQLHPHVVFALYSQMDPHPRIGIQFSRWGNADAPIASYGVTSRRLPAPFTSGADKQHVRFLVFPCWDVYNAYLRLEAGKRDVFFPTRSSE
ncbi:zinc metalloproteinase nas-14-like [Paramacrobiotus metropolitanus]|uniref:zinc metalloproteinase nas-14-like n=1 Tax=Paramacrobiotus metropolitanus TaxID=2943436 RepID=UPI00244622CD|nr:zinc metalloproteinase nas-14-like [Paramacrobiotus metropolitanus]